MEQVKKTFRHPIDFSKIQASNDNNLLGQNFFYMHELKKHRNEIDKIDYQIAQLLGKRFRIAEQVVDIKRKNNIPVRIEKRITEVLNNAKKHEQEFSLPPKLGYFLWQEIIEATCYHEEQILNAK